jgi:hypothetical protein
MRRMAMLLLPVTVLLAAAEAPGPSSGARVPETTQSGAHVNRHVDAHVPAREGGTETNSAAPESTRRRPAPDPFRGAIQPAPPPLPDATQSRRDRRY